MAMARAGNGVERRGDGLAIVKNAVALHGGTCCAENTRPHGLTIRFNIDNK